MENKTRKNHSNVYIYPVLFALCILPEAFFIARLGFYWDDWSQLFLHIKFGDTAFWEYFSYNRPLSAWTDILFFPLCGESPLRWHLLLIILKWILCILFYCISELILPGNTRLTVPAALLFACCPLFSQAYISIAYTQHFTDFILFSLSVILLLYSFRVPAKWKKIILYVLSVLCTVLHLSVTEYFAFLELIKIPLFLIAAGRNDEKNGIKKRFGSAVCYLSVHFLIFVLYCLYRLNISRFFSNFSAETPDLLYLFLKSPGTAVHSFLKNLAVDLLYPFTGFISGLFDFNIQSILTKNELLLIFVSLFIAALAGLYLRKQIPESGKISGLRFTLFCIAAMFLSVLPFLVMNENYLNTDDFAHADRTFLAAVPFVCLIFAGLLDRFFPLARLHIVAVCIMVFLFCHGQMSAYHQARIFTQQQNDFYHQLAIRVPGFTDGTAIVDDTIIFPDQGNFATASAINVLYPNRIRETGDVPVWVFSYPERLRKNHGGFHVQNRNYHFNQPPADYIYIDYDNRFANCVWVFSPEDFDNPHITELQRSWIAGTDLTRIDTAAVLKPDKAIFGTLSNNWCGFYQQASLLRQKENWDDLRTLTESVLSEGYTPSDSRSNSPFEWWPFIEALARTGETEHARTLAEEAVRTDAAFADFFENRFERLGIE